MAFIGFFPCFACVASADVPRTTKVSNAISAADFDRIAAIMRQCSIFPGNRLEQRRNRHHQLRLNPAVRLLLVMPCGVSPTEAVMLAPSNNFCSAPILRSHLSSLEESVWPAMRLVPVSAMLSFAD